MNETLSAAGEACRFRTRPRVTKIPAFTHGTGPRCGECGQISHAPARNENTGTRVRKRPAPRGVQPNFARACSQRRCWHLRKESACAAWNVRRFRTHFPARNKKALSLDQETEPCSAVPLLLLRLRRTTRNAITGVNRPCLRICTRQTSGGCSGVIFTRRGTALHRPAALWIRGGRCLSPSQRKILNYLPFFGS